MKTVLIIGISVVVSVVAIFAILEGTKISQQYSFEQEVQRSSENLAKLNALFTKHLLSFQNCDYFDNICQDRILTSWSDDFGTLSEEFGFSRAEESEYAKYFLTQFENTKEQLAECIDDEPIPDFDTSLDAQVHIDRYYSDTAYKKWFDTYYSSYTIEEAVGNAYSEDLSCLEKSFQNYEKSSEKIAVANFLLSFDNYSCENLEEILTTSKYSPAKNLLKKLMNDLKC